MLIPDIDQVTRNLQRRFRWILESSPARVGPEAAIRHKRGVLVATPELAVSFPDRMMTAPQHAAASPVLIDWNELFQMAVAIRAAGNGVAAGMQVLVGAWKDDREAFHYAGDNSVGVAGVLGAQDGSPGALVGAAIGGGVGVSAFGALAGASTDLAESRCG